MLSRGPRWRQSRGGVGARAIFAESCADFGSQSPKRPQQPLARRYRDKIGITEAKQAVLAAGNGSLGQGTILRDRESISLSENQSLLSRISP